MTASVFGAEYSAAYDLLYQDKDYEAEVDVIEHVFATHGHGRVRRVLDLGCGTGGHAAPLAQRGYEVVGIGIGGLVSEHREHHEHRVELVGQVERSDLADLEAGRGGARARPLEHVG